MLQKLPGPGHGRQRRFRRRPVCASSPCRRQGPVLLFPAEDSLAVVRQRLEGIAAAAQVPFASLPVEVITAPSLRLDTATDRAAPGPHRPAATARPA